MSMYENIVIACTLPTTRTQTSLVAKVIGVSEYGANCQNSSARTNVYGIRGGIQYKMCLSRIWYSVVAFGSVAYTDTLFVNRPKGVYRTKS